MIKIIVAALAATTLTMTGGSHAGAVEYHKVWQDGALRKPQASGVKAKTKSPSKARHVGRGLDIAAVDGVPVNTRAKRGRFKSR